MHREHSAHDERTARTRRRRSPGRDRRTGEAVPEEVAESATRRSVRNGAISMLVAAAVLLVFNSGGLRTWARGLPGNAATDVLVEVADRWHATMRHAGLTAAMAAVQDAVATFRDQRWPVTSLPSAGKTRLADEKRARSRIFGQVKRRLPPRSSRPGGGGSSGLDSNLRTAWRCPL